MFPVTERTLSVPQLAAFFRRGAASSLFCLSRVLSVAFVRNVR